MPTQTPIYDPAQAISGTATGAAIVGGRLLKVAAAKTDGNPVPVAYCGASDQPIGASQADAAQDVVGGVTIHAPSTVMPIESAGAVALGPVEVAANGRVQTLASGKKVGVAFTTAAAAAEFPLIQLQF